MRFNKIKYNPTQSEKDCVSYVLRRKEEMDTYYRDKAVATAEWARNDYEGTTDLRVGNMDILKIPLSYPAVNQRLSVLFNNQSKAEYKTIDESRKYDVEILKKTDQYDKQVGKYNADYQDIEFTAQIEGSAFCRPSWEETFDENGNTVGVPHITQKRVRINDFWWDQGARTMSEANHALERKVMTYERYLRMFVPLDGKGGFKNVRAVEPMARLNCEDDIWREDWEKHGRDESGNYVTLWFYETLGMIDGGKIVPKAIIIANGVVIYESEKLWIPKKPNQENLLSWLKIDGIPTGHMIGMGIPALIRHPQEAFDRLITLATAQAEIAVVPPVVLGPNIDWDHEDHPLQAGTTIRTRGTANDVRNAYHWFQAPDITQGASKIMEDIVQYVIMLTGVDIRALFVPASEKAITTVNKREIQEKLLRFSVQWNEDHGYYDLALRRLRLLQHYYPLRRKFVEVNDGREIVKEGNLKVPLKDYETEEMIFAGEKKIKLNYKEGGYTKIDITPENIDFNVDLVIEGATSGQERNAIEKQNFLEGWNVMMQWPAFQEMVSENPKKIVKYMLKQFGISEDEILEEPKKNNQNMHPALKEIAAIRLIGKIGDEAIEGFKFPDDIPEPEEYDPSEYVDIFGEVLRSGQYSTLSQKSQKLFNDRFDHHQKNASNPYFFDLEEKREQEEAENQAPPQGPNGQPVPQEQLEAGEEGNLMDQVRQEGAKIANITK